MTLIGQTPQYAGAAECTLSDSLLRSLQDEAGVF
jgi:hypothetical protein